MRVSIAVAEVSGGGADSAPMHNKVHMDARKEYGSITLLCFFSQWPSGGDGGYSWYATHRWGVSESWELSACGHVTSRSISTRPLFSTHHYCQHQQGSFLRHRRSPRNQTGEKFAKSPTRHTRRLADPGNLHQQYFCNDCINWMSCNVAQISKMNVECIFGDLRWKPKRWMLNYSNTIMNELNYTWMKCWTIRHKSMPASGFHLYVGNSASNRLKWHICSWSS